MSVLDAIHPFGVCSLVNKGFAFGNFSVPLVGTKNFDFICMEGFEC